MPQISSRGLAKYLTSGAASQQKILRDYKYPDPEGKAQASYYQPARDYIREYIRRGCDSAWLIRRAEFLDMEAKTAEQHRATKLRGNARVIRGFLTHFGSRKLTLLPAQRLYLRYGATTVSVSPELHVLERDSERIIVLGMSSNLEDVQARVMLQCTADAAQQAGLGIPRGSIRHWDCNSGQEIKCTDRRTRLAADIEAACRAIDAIWPSL